MSDNTGAGKAMMQWIRGHLFSRRSVTNGLLLFLAALSVTATAVAETPLEQVEVPNAEDLAFSENGRWVFASGLAGPDGGKGGLYGIEVATKQVHHLYPGENVFRDAGTGSCGPAPAEEFSPHGIALQNVSSGKETLFVVNHGGREAIEIFEVVPGDVPELVWTGCIELPEGTMGNAVAVTPDHRVFVTNMGDLMAASERDDDEIHRMGNVLTWTRGSGWRIVPDSRLFAPNGLLVTDDGNRLFVASWAGREVIQLNSDTGERRTVSVPFMPDNLRWNGEQELLAAGPHGTVDNLSACVMGQTSCDRSHGTGIAYIGQDDLNLRCNFHIRLPLGTVALPVRDTLWVGPVSGEHIWIIGGRDGTGEKCSE